MIAFVIKLKTVDFGSQILSNKKVYLVLEITSVLVVLLSMQYRLSIL